MIDSKRLLGDLQEQVRLLEVDLARQLVEVPGTADLLRGEYEDERKARRTAAEWPAWRDAQLTQIAVAWVLGTVFLRWSEDNGLIDPVLSGPGSRLDTAVELQMEHFRRHPEHHDGDWLAEQFEVLRTTDAGRLLFDPEHNPMYWVPISHDAAKVLIAFWRSRDGAGLRHDFADPEWDTRFLGDLYQDLSEDAKKRFALLQTPRFIERFILDRTLTPAMEEFGLDGLRLIDPACGSGHFLLGAFGRLVEAWQDPVYGLDAYEVVGRSLESVHGVDTNPFAVAIARFRLLVAALKAAGVLTFDAARRQAWRPLVACTDSLRTKERQESIAEVDAAIGYRAKWEDIDDFDHERLLESASYHVVVGNPPYITVKDPEHNKYYRKRWSACHRQFQLTVPFAQRIFDLATRPGEDGFGAGYTGQITSNAFMKREFGTKVVEEFFPTVELTYVVDTSGVYIPGHGTPTVMLIGRRATPSRRDAVRAVLGVRGEPAQPDDPEKGLVWTAIEAQVEHAGSESEWVSVVDLPRARLTTHPWSLSGGGADSLMATLSAGRDPLALYIDTPIGRAVRLGADLAFVRPRCKTYLASPREVWRNLVDGEQVRDWRVRSLAPVLYPYGGEAERRYLRRELWPLRALLAERRTFSGNMADAGRDWWEYMQHTPSAYETQLSISFSNVSTHNHFSLRRGGEVFDAHAPVIKLPAQAGEDEHLALLGVLNSALACFWMKEVSQDKGNGGIGGGIGDEGWEPRYEFTGSKLEQLPVPAELPVAAATHLDSLVNLPSSSFAFDGEGVERPTRETLARARRDHDRLRAEMISWDPLESTCRHASLSIL